MSLNSFKTHSTFTLNHQIYAYYDLNQLPTPRTPLPYSLKILLENVLRLEDGVSVTAQTIEALLNWTPKSAVRAEIAFTPARVILQDLTGVPAIVDLAAMRTAMKALGGDPGQINPLSPVELVIDHSVMVDYFGTPEAFNQNVEKEFERNEERYSFLRWGQTAFQNFKVVPPGTGIVHQVNLEYLARGVCTDTTQDPILAYPDTLVGTDSHTTMINGLGILGWGVGGIEAEAALLGQPITLLVPEVVGVKLVGALPEGTTATDLVLTLTELLRKKNVVGKWVEFYGDGLDHLPVADRATIANMAPEYGATCGMFPIDAETLKFMALTGRTADEIALVETYAKAQGLFRSRGAIEASYSETLLFDLNTLVPSIAGPKRPQDRVPLKEVKPHFHALLEEEALPPFTLKPGMPSFSHGAVVIAAITSCTNTSNPSVMIAAGLLAQKATELGLKTQPWVKTSLAPGSQVVTDYLIKAELMAPLEALGFQRVGYGCTTCIGNSGPLAPAIESHIQQNNLSVSAVLSGNRNFEGRIHPSVRYAYLASPPLVVAYALAGTLDMDFATQPLGYDRQQKPVYLKEIWPKASEIQSVLLKAVSADLYRSRYQSVFEGPQQWKQLSIPKGEQFEWNAHSTYVKLPPYFTDMKAQPEPLADLRQARALAVLPDSVTTDHISPAGNIDPNSPAGLYLKSLGVLPQDFNSYGARRGNHEVMVRGTFANIRLKNQLVKGVEGNWTLYLPKTEKMSIFDAAMQYQADKTPLIVIAGKEYGTGSSRDWAAKGPKLLGVKVVIAESFERIHRSNLIGMGILPLQFLENQNLTTLQLNGHEYFDIPLSRVQAGQTLTVSVTSPKTQLKSQFQALVRIDTPQEFQYYQEGGILPYVLRQLLKGK